MRVRLFAALREMAGTSWLEDERAPDVDALVHALGLRFGPEFERVARAGAAVVGGELVEVGTALAPDDEVSCPRCRGSASALALGGAAGWSRSTTTSPPGWRAASARGCRTRPSGIPTSGPRSSSPGKTTAQGAQPMDA